MQNILWVILELTANLFETFLYIRFVINSFDKKVRIFGLKTTYAIGTLTMTAVVTALNQFTAYEGLLGLIYTVLILVFSVFFLHGSFLKKLFISILTNICLISTAVISGNILSAIFKGDSMEIYTEHSFERFAFMIMGIALLAYILEIISNFTGGKKQLLSPKEWIMILMVLVISFFVIAVLHIIILDGETENEHINLLMAAEIGIIFINIICLYITVNLNETHRREEQLLIDKKRNEYSGQYARSIKEQYEQTRRLRHDMKQYAAAMQVLIKNGKFSEAENLAEKQTENLSRIETLINVENDFLNAILNYKLSYAKSKEIDVFCSIENDISGIEDIDLCNLIGNLLDNAILASEKCEPESRLIEIKISSVGSRLVMIVKNSIHNSVLKENPELKSTKTDSAEHGFGIKTIKYIAAKYNGKFDYYEEGLTFVSRVELHKEKNEQITR